MKQTTIKDFRKAVKILEKYGIGSVYRSFRLGKYYYMPVLPGIVYVSWNWITGMGVK